MPIPDYTLTSGTVAQIYNPGTWKVEAGGATIQHPGSLGVYFWPGSSERTDINSAKGKAAIVLRQKEHLPRGLVSASKGFNLLPVPAPPSHYHVPRLE